MPPKSVSLLRLVLRFAMGVVMPPESVVRIPAAWLADAARRADGGPAQDPKTGFQFLSGSHAGNS